METLLIVIIVIAIFLVKQWLFNIKRKQRWEYYRDLYLKSDEWQREQYVVM